MQLKVVFMLSHSYKKIQINVVAYLMLYSLLVDRSTEMSSDAGMRRRPRRS